MAIVNQGLWVRHATKKRMVSGPEWYDRCERVTRTKIKLFPDGHGSIVVRQVASIVPAVQSSSPEESRQRSLVRAQTNVKDRIMALGADRMVTLTYRQNMLDADATREHLRQFMLQIKKRYPSFKCVAARERQKRGSFHWHMACRGWLDINHCRRTWCRIIGESEAGQFNLTKVVRDAKKLFYIAKYVGKDMDADERPRYGHHYVTSRGLQFAVLKRTLINCTFAEAMDAARQLLSDEHGVTPDDCITVSGSDAHYLQCGVMRW